MENIFTWYFYLGMCESYLRNTVKNSQVTPSGNVWNCLKKVSKKFTPEKITWALLPGILISGNPLRYCFLQKFT